MPPAQERAGLNCMGCFGVCEATCDVNWWQ